MECDSIPPRLRASQASKKAMWWEVLKRPERAKRKEKRKSKKMGKKNGKKDKNEGQNEHGQEKTKIKGMAIRTNKESKAGRG